MKLLFINLIIFSYMQSSFVHAANKTSCESLQKKAIKLCEESMCADQKSANGECTKDADFYEGLQICADETFVELIRDYNSNHPSEPLGCRG